MISNVTIPASWWEWAACQGGDPEWWQPVGEVLTDDNLAALAICAHCPVQYACLMDALTIATTPGSYPPGGIWGGTTEAQRAEFLRTGRDLQLAELIA